PRGADSVLGARGRPRRSPSPVQLSRVVERRRGMMPPVQGRPRERPSRARIAGRRAAALLVLLGAAAVALLVVFVAVRGRTHHAAPTTTAVAAPPPLRIVF